MRFFFDNCISPAIAAAMQDLSAKTQDAVVHLREKFPPDVKDDVWLPTLAKEGGWIVISGDGRILRTPHLRRIWLEAGLTTFFMVDEFANKKLLVQAEVVVHWWTDITDFAKKMERGAGFKVPLKGKKMEQVR